MRVPDPTPLRSLLRVPGRDHASGVATAELCMGLGLVPRAPFGHSRRRDDEAGIYRDRAYPRQRRLCHDAGTAVVTGRLDPTPDVAGAGAWKEALLGGDPGGPG